MKLSRGLVERLHDAGALDPDTLTPVLKGTRYRLHLRGDWIEGELSRGAGFKGVFLDTETGVHYRIEGKPCSAGDHCFCDAWAIPDPNDVEAGMLEGAP